MVLAWLCSLCVGPLIQSGPAILTLHTDSRWLYVVGIRYTSANVRYQMQLHDLTKVVGWYSADAELMASPLSPYSVVVIRPQPAI